MHGCKSDVHPDAKHVNRHGYWTPHLAASLKRLTHQSVTVSMALRTNSRCQWLVSFGSICLLRLQQAAVQAPVGAVGLLWKVVPPPYPFLQLPVLHAWRH